jgi:hypothetical protein
MLRCSYLLLLMVNLYLSCLLLLPTDWNRINRSGCSLFFFVVCCGTRSCLVGCRCKPNCLDPLSVGKRCCSTGLTTIVDDRFKDIYIIFVLVGNLIQFQMQRLKPDGRGFSSN